MERIPSPPTKCARHTETGFVDCVLRSCRISTKASCKSAMNDVGYKTFIFECNLTGSAVVPAHVTAQLRDFGNAWTTRWSVRRERLAIRGLHARAVQRSPSGYASAHRRGTSRACPCRPRAALPDGQRLPAGHVQRLLSLCRCLFAPASTAHLKSSWSSSVARPVSSVQCTRENRESRTEPSSRESRLRAPTGY